jgi:hypothetical protein
MNGINKAQLVLATPQFFNAAELQEAAELLAVGERQVPFVLKEKQEEWPVLSGAIALWLGWGCGGMWYEIVGQYPPEWAVKIRADWDQAWG